MILYNNFISSENQKVLRERLFFVMTKRCLSFYTVGKEMGCSHVTVFAFLTKDRDVSRPTLSRILGFIEKNEKLA